MGQRFEKLVVVKLIRDTYKKGSTWLCKCDCGGERQAKSHHLKQERVKSCGCIKSKAVGPGSKYWTGHGEISGNFWNQIMRRGTNKSGRERNDFQEFDLTIEYIWDLFILQDRKCALSGLPLRMGMKQSFSMSETRTASLDRIDSSKGYVKGNVQWVHKHVNLMKNTLDETYFLELCKAVTDYQETKNGKN
jgi:hypothetical protein